MTPTEARRLARDILALGHVVLRKVSWSFYTFVINKRDLADQYARITYDTGAMEVFMGAGVQWELIDPLTTFLTGFTVDGDSPLAPADLPENPSADSERDEIYHVHLRPLLAPAAPTGIHNAHREVEVTIVRSALTPAQPGEETATIGPAQLRVRGWLHGRIVDGTWEPVAGTIQFPGISLADHFDFVHPE